MIRYMVRLDVKVNVIVVIILILDLPIAKNAKKDFIIWKESAIHVKEALLDVCIVQMKKN